ncbi:MAG: DUF4573 domain-containing protein, partial [Ruminococcus sp.]
MKTFKKSMAIILSILMLVSVMTVAGISASAADYSGYCLIGYIDGADVGDKDDYANVPPENVFAEDGTLTFTFAETSYVCVKTTDCSTWFMTDDWQGEVTEVTLYNTSTVDLGTTANKLMVPAGTVTFTLVENEDGTLTLSYVVAQASEDTTPSESETVSDDTTASETEASSDTEVSEASSETDPSEASSETDPSEASSETDPSEASSETDPSEASSETEPSEASSETEPSEASSETEPSEASSETEPSEASSETEPSEAS